MVSVGRRCRQHLRAEDSDDGGTRVPHDGSHRPFAESVGGRQRGELHPRGEVAKGDGQALGRLDGLSEGCVLAGDHRSDFGQDQVKRVAAHPEIGLVPIRVHETQLLYEVVKLTASFAPLQHLGDPCSPTWPSTGLLHSHTEPRLSQAYTYIHGYTYQQYIQNA